MLKKHATLTLFFCLLGLIANAQIVNIPDANFKNALVNTKCVDTDGNGLGDNDADTNNDGEIQVSEALAVKWLFISDRSIQSLTGIEAFGELVLLNCNKNELMSLNVQELTTLQYLFCADNLLTALNLQALINLQSLDCERNQLTNLNIQGLKKLFSLNCSENQLTTLNVQGLTNLLSLLCYDNQLTGINVQGLIKLQSLTCSNNPLMALDVQGLVNLQTLGCAKNQLTTLNLQGLTNLQLLYCPDNQLASLDVQGLVKLQNLNCYGNQLTSLDLQGLSNLERLRCEGNQLVILNVQGLAKLYQLICGDNQLTALNVQGLANLLDLQCNGNQLTNLNVWGLSKLKYFYCFDNQLTTLDLRELLNLQALICERNQLQTLDIQGLVNLSTVRCNGNLLTTLNLQSLYNLNSLDCSFNQLAKLYVQGLTKLYNLNCSVNQLTTLDLQGVNNLNFLYCNNNQLSTLYIKNGIIEFGLDFSNNPQLSYICCDEGQLSDVQDQAIQNGLTNCYINTSCFQIGAHIKGDIRQDQNLNCQADATETGVAGRIIKAEKQGSEPFYAITNSAGHYEIVVDTGLYKLSVPNALSNNYYALCEDNIEVNLPKTEDTVGVDFLLTPVIFCPLLEVNIASARMRRCFENQYIVRYCNTGPVAAPNAQVTVTLSKDVQFVSSSIPGVNIGGRRWSFPLGEVASEDCGSFSINFLVLCDSTVLGQSICASAHITPDSICTPSNASWSGAEVVVDGYCEGDSVRFVIRNIGTGDMTETRRFIIVEDIVIFRTGDFNLQAGDSLVLKVRANGSTYRLEAEQEVTHPFPSMPSATVEGCGQNLGGLFSLGFVSQFNEIDGNPFYSRDCREVVGSYDPNDKSAQPTGVDAPHYIEPNTSIDYLIRFQNTGTDTAFTVVIRDTLSPWLDVESFRAGISDHDYKVDIEKSNILKFTFNNILLPDSNVNEPASHGFVRFRITPKSSTPLGTKIENRAAIFFDFNAPIITNWVFHTVDTGFLKRKVLSVFAEKTPVEQQVYPNPVRSGELLYFADLPEGQSRISLMDPLGKTAFVAQLKGNSLHLPADLPPGMYFLEWAGENGVKRWGKIWVTE